MKDEENKPFVTTEEMRRLLHDEAFAGLRMDELTGKYVTDYFYADAHPTLLKTHLLVEQLAEHCYDVDWPRVTVYFNISIIAAIKHAYFHPLVWLDESELRAQGIECVLEGKIAMESDFIDRELPLTCFLECELPEEIIKWFVSRIPNGDDGTDNPPYYFPTPNQMIVWGYITTDYSTITDNPESTPPFFSRDAMGRNIQFIAQNYSDELAVKLVKELQNDWEDIVDLNLFGLDKISEDAVKDFKTFLFKWLNRAIAVQEANKKKAEQAQLKAEEQQRKLQAEKLRQQDPDSSFFRITEEITYDMCREELLTTLQCAKSKAAACKNLQSSTKAKYFDLRKLQDDAKASLINPWMKMVNNTRIKTDFTADDFCKAR